MAAEQAAPAYPECVHGPAPVLGIIHGRKALLQFQKLLLHDKDRAQHRQILGLPVPRGQPLPELLLALRVKGRGLVHRVVVALIRLHLLHAGYVRQIFAVRKGIEHVLDIDHFHGDSPWFSQLSASVSARKCVMTRNIGRN